MTKHDKAVLSKLVNDPNFNMKDAQDALDMGSRNGTINRVKNTAVEVLQELNWTVNNSHHKDK